MILHGYVFRPPGSLQRPVRKKPVRQLIVTVYQLHCMGLFSMPKNYFTHRSLFWSSLAKLCMDIFTTSTSLVRLPGKAAFELRWRRGENLNLEEQFLQRETPGGSGLTDLLLRKSTCLLSFSTVLMLRASFSLVGLRHDVTLLRSRSCSCLLALISTFWSKVDFARDVCGLVGASMARR